MDGRPAAAAAATATGSGDSNSRLSSSVRSSSSSPAPGGGGAYAQWLGVEEDRYSGEFELVGDSSGGMHPNACHRLHHIIMEIELAATPMICLVVWTVLFEGVAARPCFPATVETEADEVEK